MSNLAHGARGEGALHRPRTRDLADWLGIRDVGLYNFRPSVRPVLLVVHISSYPGKHYCPRIATINKPAFQGIKQHSTAEPRQSRSRTSS